MKIRPLRWHEWIRNGSSEEEVGIPREEQIAYSSAGEVKAGRGSKPLDDFEIYPVENTTNELPFRRGDIVPDRVLVFENVLPFGFGSLTVVGEAMIEHCFYGSSLGLGVAIVGDKTDKSACGTS